MSSFELFKIKTLPEAIAAGYFGKNAKFVGLAESATEGKDQFSSTVKFVNLELNVDGVPRKFPLVCKFQCESAERREKFVTGPQFFNEVLVYKDIVPLLHPRVLNILPEFYLGVATLNQSPADDVVVVENLIPKGFRHSDEKVFLDFDHCLLAFRRLGEFHGASLLLKTKSPLKFANKINRLLETRYLEKRKDEQNYFLSENAKRGVIPLMKNGEHLQVLTRLVDRLVDVHGIMKDIFEVNEMSVLCHGDFCRNNMLFKYENGRPVDVMLYDLATARYASPVIDISFFLFLNTTPELRRKHFREDLLRVYLEAVRGVAGVDAPTPAELWEEFKCKALYGYILAAFFLPMMLDDGSRNLDHELVSLTMEDRVKQNLIRGGQKVTDILAESVRDLVTWGCLQKCAETRPRVVV